MNDTRVVFHLGRKFTSDSILHLQALPFVVRKARRTLESLDMTLQDVILIRSGANPWSMLADSPDGEPVLPRFIRNWKPDGKQRAATSVEALPVLANLSREQSEKELRGLRIPGKKFGKSVMSRF